MLAMIGFREAHAHVNVSVVTDDELGRGGYIPKPMGTLVLERPDQDV
jgi:hypothetical protein